MRHTPLKCLTITSCLLLASFASASNVYSYLGGTIKGAATGCHNLGDGQLTCGQYTYICRAAAYTTDSNGGLKGPYPVTGAWKPWPDGGRFSLICNCGSGYTLQVVDGPNSANTEYVSWCSDNRRQFKAHGARLPYYQANSTVGFNNGQQIWGQPVVGYSESVLTRQTSYTAPTAQPKPQPTAQPKPSQEQQKCDFGPSCLAPNLS